MALFGAACSSCNDSGGGNAADPTTNTGAGGQAACQLVETGWGPAGTVPLRVDKAVTGLRVPWGLVFLPGGDWLVTERPGRVRVVQGGTLVPQPVAEVSLGGGGEGGLLGIALHPQFSDNRFFYLYYTANKNGSTVNRVQRYVLSADHRSATPDRVILDDIAAAPFHDGGRIKFGPDGMLYVGTGDAGSPNRSQDPASPNGKILRVTPDGGVSTVFVSGVRNVQAFDWADTGTLLVVDHGPSGDLGLTGLDEVSFAVAGSNLGWPVITGCGAAQGMVTPILSWRQAAPPGGAVVYRGSAIPEFSGNLMIAMLGMGDPSAMQLHRVNFDPVTRTLVGHEVYLQGQFGRLRDIVQGPDGAIYVTTSNCDGRGNCPGDGDYILKITRGTP